MDVATKVLEFNLPENIETSTITTVQLAASDVAEKVVQPFVEQILITEETPAPEHFLTELEIAEDDFTQSSEIAENINIETSFIDANIDEEFETQTQESINTEQEFVQAALLWSEQWGEQQDSFVNGVESPNTEEVYLLDYLPIGYVELTEKLESIPEPKLQEAAQIINSVFEVMSEVMAIENIGEVKMETTKIKLEQIVERLFVCLEIEHQEEHVIAFVQAILNGEIEINFEQLLTLQDEGMHERKYTSAWILAVLNQKATSNKRGFAFVGSFVLALFLGSDSQLLGHSQLA